jgi:hypothetical protein
MYALAQIGTSIWVASITGASQSAFLLPNAVSCSLHCVFVLLVGGAVFGQLVFGYGLRMG